MRLFKKKLISILIPTYNEEKNIVKLINDIKHHLKEIDYEIIIIDDESDDQTAQNILELNSNKVKLIQREYDRGLIQSVKFGIQIINGEYFVVMDGDGQHTAKDLKKIINELYAGGDVVIGIRNFKKISSSLSFFRKASSRIFNKLIKINLRIEVKDPLSGFFGAHIKVLNKKFYQLDSSGFKILLDLIFSIKNKKFNIKQEYIEFLPRYHGTSKLNFFNIFEFGSQMLSFLLQGIVSPKVISFLIVGFLGSIIHFSVLFVSLYFFEIKFIYSHTAAILFANVFNFYLNNLITFSDNKYKGFNIIKGYLKYLTVNFFGILANIGSAGFIYSSSGNKAILSSLIGVIIEIVFKFSLSKSFVWKK